MQLSYGERGFELSFRGHPLLRHSDDAPCVTVGRGEGRFRLNKGNFRIDQQLQRRTPPRRFQVTHHDETRVALALEQMLELEAQVEQGRLELRLRCSDPSINRTWLRLVARADEQLYGGGEQFSRLNLKGSRLPLWAQEAGVGRGHDLITLLCELREGGGGRWHTTYFPQPTVVSSAGYFWHAHSTCYAEMDFRAPGEHRFCFWGVPGRLSFGCAASLPELLGGLTELLGRQPPLPEWAFDGVWLGVQGGTEAVSRRLQRARQAGVVVGALWAQDWVGRRVTSFGKQLMWNWRFEPELYPDLPREIERWQSDGVRVLGYINPFLVPEGELYHQAKERGYLVRDAQGEVLHVTITTFPAAMLDLTNPEAVRWIKAVMRDNLLGIGLSGWMADFGEYLPTDAVLASGESAETYHNRYPAEWARVNQEAIEEAGLGGQAAFFVRAGYSGTSRHATSVWTGDQLASWSHTDGLASVIPASLSLGFSGVGLTHFDIGGYTSLAWIRRTRELFMRWAELGAFSLLMRTHEGNRPEQNWQLDSDRATLQHYARLSRVHVALKPYLLQAMQQYSARGLPVMRHPCLHYPGDAALQRQRHQYLLGRDLLVAPVIARGHRWRRLQLPDDQWVHLWSGRRHRGGRTLVRAPLGQPPVFYRTASPFAALLRRIGAMS